MSLKKHRLKFVISKDIIFINFKDLSNTFFILSKSLILKDEAINLAINWFVPIIGIFKSIDILREVEKIVKSTGEENILTKSSVILGIKTERSEIFHALREKFKNEFLSKKLLSHLLINLSL